MEHQQSDLTRQLKALWRFKWMIVLVALVAGGTAAGFTARQPPVYEATATVMVESGEPVLALPAGLEITFLQDVGSQVEMIGSRRVLEQAVVQLEPEKATNPQYLQLEVDKLRDALNVQQVRGTSLLAVTVVSLDPVTAQKQADAVAEAYVYEARRLRLTAIETSLENATKQLKELGTSKIDLSISPSLTRLTTHIDTALIALDAVSEHLQEIRPYDDVASQEQPASMAEDTGTVLTPSQLNIISEWIGATASEANELLVLVQKLRLRLDLGFEVSGADIAVIESRTRALNTKLGGLSAEMEAMRRAEINPQAYKELLAIEELVRVANATGAAILEQAVALYGETDASLQDRILQHTTVLATTLEEAFEHTTLLATALGVAPQQVQQIEPEAASLAWWQLEMLNERVATAIVNLQALSQQLQPLAPEQGILLTHAELAAMEISARTVAIALSFLLSEVEGMRLGELDPQVYTELLNVNEEAEVANDATSVLMNEIADLATEGGGGRLSYAALDNLRQELSLALLTSDAGGVGVVDRAAVSTLVTNVFGRYRNVILAVVAALLLGVLSALVLQYFDRRVRDASQVTSYVGLPMMASIASTTAGRTPHPPSVLNESASQYLETFRMLRTNLRLDSYQGQVLLVSSPEEKEGKTTVAANLAQVVALQDRRVLLIDGNLQQPAIASIFGLAEGEGLSEFLTGESGLQSYITKVEGVDVLPAGVVSAKSAEMLSSPRMKALLEKAKQTYDVVIVDSASVMGYADTKIQARDADGVLLVLQPGASNLDLARESKQALETMGVRVVGFVLNKAGIEERKYP